METANNGTLSPERLEAALNAVTARYDPDQVILFGSAARGTMTPDSDIDLMVIKPEYDPAGRMRVTKIRAGGESVDVVELGPRTAEKKRMTAGSVERNALHEGMTVHLRNAAVVPVAVGPSWFEAFAVDGGPETVRWTGRREPRNGSLVMAPRSRRIRQRAAARHRPPTTAGRRARRSGSATVQLGVSATVRTLTENDLATSQAPGPGKTSLRLRQVDNSRSPSAPVGRHPAPRSSFTRPAPDARRGRPPLRPAPCRSTGSAARSSAACRGRSSRSAPRTADC